MLSEPIFINKSIFPYAELIGEVTIFDHQGGTLIQTKIAKEKCFLSFINIIECNKFHF